MAKIDIPVTNDNEDWLQKARKDRAKENDKKASIAERVVTRHAERTAAETRMKAGMWYIQTFGSHQEIWFLAERELKNEGFAGKKVEYRGRSPKAIKTSIPKGFWSLWKEIPKSEVPDEILAAV